MKYLCDSDRAIDFLKGRPEALQLVRRLTPHGLAISLMSYGELYEGILGSTNPDEHEHQFREFLRIADVLPFTATTMQCFARIRMDLRARGMLIRDADLLIAATAMTEDLTLVTGNLRHFERIDGLDIYRAGRS